MVLLIDCGNSRVKWRRWDGQVFHGPGAVPAASWRELFTDQSPVEALVVSDVGRLGVGEQIAKTARAIWPGCEPITFRPTGTLAGVTNGYAEPSRLGADRWAAIVGAHSAFGRVPLIVVDAGTAVTVDLITEDARHVGGYILPGRVSMANALSADTGLPLVEFGRSVGLQPGVNTRDCFVAGIKASVTGLVIQARAQLGREAQVVVTGGDADWFEFVDSHRDPDLVFRGLAQFYEHCPEVSSV